MAVRIVREEIDEIMEQMELATPRSSANLSIDVEDPLASSTRISDDTDAKVDKPNEPLVSNFIRDLFRKSPSKEKPGHKHPSTLTSERYYDYTNSNIGIAVIFNQVRFKEENERKGSEKDAQDLKAVLDGMGFDVQIFKDFTTRQIRDVLDALSKHDHSDNDCLLITIMTHGKRGGIIFSSDGEFRVNDLWENFTGNNCETLIGKPKLFFIQACRGEMTDPGILFKPKPKARALGPPSDVVDAKLAEPHFVIPTLADLLIMYSVSEGFYSFRNPHDGSWFIQALCEELRENPQDEIMTILTGVNRRVAFGRQSYVPQKPDWDASKQMPVIQSMLTKSLYFLNKDQKERMKLRLI